MARKHRKQFSDLCHYKVRKGFVNQADGSWKQASSPPTTSEHHLFAGYKVAGARAGKQKGRKSKD